jgi:hypothetical protein
LGREMIDQRMNKRKGGLDWKIKERKKRRV